MLVADSSSAPLSLERGFVPLSQQESEILSGVLEESSSLELAIPSEIDPEQLWDTIEACCRVAGAISKANERIKPIVGRLLVVLKDYPEVYQARGYHSYEDFIARGLHDRYGISRTEAYACRKVAEKFPSLTNREFQQIGVTKLYALAAMTEEGDKDCPRLIEKAKDPSVTRAQLQSYGAELKYAEKGEFDRTDIQINVSKAIAARWREFCEESLIKAYVGGTGTPGVIFERMMEEVAGEWMVQGRHILDAISGGPMNPAGGEE